MKPILITSYVDPDLDGAASAIGYAEFLKKRGENVTAALMGEPHDEVKYILDRFNFKYPEKIENADGFDEVILLDKSDPNGLEGKIAPEKIIEIIDHRKVHQADKFPNAKVQIELVGAAATLITEKFMEKNIEISKEAATLLYGAIISNTLNFKGTLTTERDTSAAKWLNQTAGLPDNFWKELFTAKSDLSGKKLSTRIRGDLVWFEASGKKVGIAQIEMIGAENLIEERADEIITELDKIKAERRFDLIFLNTIELEASENFFVTGDGETRKLLEKVLKVSFNGSVARRPSLIMRKQIIPLLKEELER